MEKHFLMVVRNYCGVKEINYLLTLEDFKSMFCTKECENTFFSSHDLEKDWSDFLRTLATKKSAEWALANNDTLFVTIPQTDEDVESFLLGNYNEDITEVIFNNLGESLIETIERYADWYWHFVLEDSSKSVVEMVSKKYPHLLTDEEHSKSVKEYVLECLPDLTGDHFDEANAYLSEAGDNDDY